MNQESPDAPDDRMNQDAPDAPDGRMNQDAQDGMDPQDCRMDWMNQNAQEGPILDRRVHFNHDRWLPIGHG